MQINDKPAGFQEIAVGKAKTENLSTQGEADVSDGFLGKVKDGVSHVIHKADEWTSPMETTGGDFKEASYFQAGSHAASSGFAIAGFKGAVAGIAASSVGIFVEKRTKSTVIGMVAGATSSAIVGGFLGSTAGPVGIVAGAATGTLLGAYQVLRGNADAGVRDGSGNAGLITGPFLPGPTKLAGGIGTGIAMRYGNSNISKALIGAGTAAAIGAVVAVAGFSPVGLLATIGINAAAGAISPFMGPRFSQFFRNMSNVAGNYVEKAANKLHIIDKPLTEMQKNMVGALPSSYAKEAIRSFILSDGSIGAVAVAGLSEAIEQVHIFINSKKEEKERSKLDGALEHQPVKTWNDAGKSISLQP
jgi:hypothetical protein